MTPRLYHTLHFQYSLAVGKPLLRGRIFFCVCGSHKKPHHGLRYSHTHKFYTQCCHPPQCTAVRTNNTHSLLFSCPRARGRLRECGCSRFPSQALDMMTHRKTHNIKSNRRRQLKHLLLSGNKPTARKHKVTRQITQETTDYSKLGWKVFTDWDKHRYVLPSELEEYNITNLRRRSLLGGPTFGIRTSVDDGRPLGYGTQAPQCGSAPAQNIESSTHQRYHFVQHSTVNNIVKDDPFLAVLYPPLNLSMTEIMAAPAGHT